MSKTEKVKTKTSARKRYWSQPCQSTQDILYIFEKLMKESLDFTVPIHQSKLAS